MGLAPIERLPVELLQPIFIASGHNVALLKASQNLAARLSSKRIYHSACDYHLIEVRGMRAEQSAAQTYIFTSKWMTWEFFKSWILRRFGPKGCLCGLTPDKGCFDAQWPPNFEDATKMVFSRSHLPRLAFVTGRIPKKLLRGPWNQEKVEFLRFLLWITSMTVDWAEAEAHQTAIEGRKQAMLEKNLEAAELFNHNRRLGKTANLETVRFAVMEAECDRSIVYDTLLVANMWATNGSARHCAKLHGWCEARTAEGDPKGQWLRTKLKESRIFRSQREADDEDGPGYSSDRDLELDPETRDYDDGSGDHLTVNNLEWNKVSDLWFSSESHAFLLSHLLDSCFSLRLRVSLSLRTALGPSNPEESSIPFKNAYGW
ncbi:hypothetical protein EJ02DRAFT_259668 [Clathrospora elynae]|uniref:Uncharacterized protein n=1 Tax=Clathrospora elynae TaxID=706981 RepID=A0A6A5SF43_9PLEO|nr:hypothetical protein EJ02DRAFT_259668 [Clathrospora elynae]